MKLTRLLVAAVVLAGLGGALWWSNKQEKAKADKPAADASPRILTLTQGYIKGIEIGHRDGETTVLKKDGDKWSITAPKPLAADSGAVESLTNSAQALMSERVVDDHVTDLASYGLMPALITLKFSMMDGSTHTLLIGDDTTTGSGVFAKVADDPRLFTMGSMYRDTFNKSSKDLRDKRLMTFDRDKSSRVELDIAKQPPIEFGRIGPSEWQVLKPKPMRADGFQVEDILGQAIAAQMDPALTDEDAKKNAAAFASGTPLATLSVTDPGGTQKMEVRKSGDAYYAKSSVVDGVHKLMPDLPKLLDKKLDDFRNKKIFDFAFTDPNKIEVHDGSKAYLFEKTGDDWTSGGKKMDSVSIQALIDKLRDLAATKFPESGFTTPTLEMTVVSDSGKRTEKVQIAPSGSDYLAKREGDTSLYFLDAMIVKDLRTSLGDVKESTAPPAKK
ncbi:MAG TPA: DUF4340 domain-containing protein [Bryobacteraceae bacterium]|jgi:hypothetical protein